MTKISLVRHGLVENPDEVYYGRLPGFKLADEGRAQAAAAGRYLAWESVAVVYHSPMLRAVQTAEVLCAQLDEPTPLVECDLLNEIHSPYDGQTAEEMERRDWDFYSEIDSSYEQPDEILARVLSFFEHVREKHPRQHVVGVSHGDPIAFAVLWAFGRLPSTQQRRYLLECGVSGSYPARASISTFTFADQGEGGLLSFRYHCPSDEL
jgi:broad specificity phosphatase PhoE